MPGAAAIVGKLAAALAAASLSVAAQAAGEAERALLLREQQQEDYSLRLKQFRELSDPALTAARRRALELRQRGEMQRLEAIHQDQLLRHETLEQQLPLLPEPQRRLELQREGTDLQRQRVTP